MSLPAAEAPPNTPAPRLLLPTWPISPPQAPYCSRRCPRDSPGWSAPPGLLQEKEMRGRNLHRGPPSRPTKPGEALTVDPELDAVLLGLRALDLAQEDTLILGGDMAQDQRGPSVLQAEPLLVLARFTLALALAHAEDERRLLLVHLRAGVQGDVRVP